MLFKNEDTSLKLDIVSYEFRADEGDPTSDDRNWLVVRATYTDEDGKVIKDSNSCLLTYELKEMDTELKVLAAGLKDRYESDFAEPYFSLKAGSDGEDGFWAEVSFVMPNTMEDLDIAEISAHLTREELRALVDELDRLCAKFPYRS